MVSLRMNRLLLTLLFAASVSPVLADERGVAIEANKVDDGHGGLVLNVSMNRRDDANSRSVRDMSPKDSVVVGEFVTVCATSNQAGYITIWNLDTSGTVRIYPNVESHEGGDRLLARKIEPGEEVCVGDADDDFRMTIVEPGGPAAVIVYWTQTQEANFAADAFPVIGGSRSAGSAVGYSSKRFMYHVETGE